MAKNKKKKKRLIIVPAVLCIAVLALGWGFYIENKDSFRGFKGGSMTYFGKNEIPEEYIPVYKEAEEEYGVPWNLLASIHRIETVFSTMDNMVSPAGAIGHMQFMPCTFVGWNYPGCAGGLGDAEIAEDEMTDPDVINEYGGYGVDASGNGKADPWDIEDAVFSAAKFLAANGAAEGNYENAVFAYNRADWYVDEVLEYADNYSEDFVAVDKSEQTVMKLFSSFLP
ncbi:lytic transglycosylase domain-containing protein [Thalassorhabdus alkalitolerans]|uniref:Lytic transglycosylase domain-containing protein n=1 Tax=Thalassorhabdus alkalitolerans TaxID=2282697 RepID=A0ABW0YSP2_9BACI